MPAASPTARLSALTPRGLARGLRTTEWGLVTMALVVGAAAGAAAVGFRYLVEGITYVVSGSEDYAATPGASHPWLPALGPWFVVLAPVVTGLVYGPLVHAFAREARGHGVPEVMYAVARTGGRIKPQVAGVKALASALCIGGGGSVGREGPIVQIGSALGSSIARTFRLGEPRTKALVACGAAGGIAATFNAPLAGVFFAMEIILVDFAAQAFAVVVLAAVTASVIGRAAFGDEAFLSLPEFTVDHLAQYPLFAVLGVLAGLAGVLFTKVLYAVEDGCDAVWQGPEWLRPAVGGLALGLLLLVVPQMYGVGYPVLAKGVAGGYAVGFLVVLLLAKILATSLTIGIGGSGGVFAPSLFIGAMLGSAYGQALGEVAPGIAGPAGAYALIGMGAVFAGSARAPITAVVILFELTGEYSIILPLMAAIVLATTVSRLVTRDTIYTLKLRRRGIDLSAPSPRIITGGNAAGAMGPLPEQVVEDATLLDAAGVLATSGEPAVLVVADDGSFLGLVSSGELADTLADGKHDDVAIGSLAVAPRRVRQGDTLEDALAALDESGAGAVVVLDDDGRPAGWLTHRAVLAALRKS